MQHRSRARALRDLARSYFPGRRYTYVYEVHKSEVGDDRACLIICQWLIDAPSSVSKTSPALTYAICLMSAITDLNQLLIHMEPCLQDDEFVFCTFPDKRYGAYCELEPLCAFQEKEGLTLILLRSQADRVGISYDGSYRAITLQVHSSLEAVGLTAAVAAKLTAHNISANVVAAYHHDHIFVSTAQAKQAVQALRDLSAESAKRTEVVEHVQGSGHNRC